MDRHTVTQSDQSNLSRQLETQEVPPDLFGVFGDPVFHSLSPVMHNSAFAATGYPGIYLPFRVTNISEAISALRTLGLKGVSVTLPHKIAVMEYLDKIDKESEKIGAVNTIHNINGVLTGYNSDIMGALAAIQERTPIKDQRVAILGAGGAARAIGFGITKNQGKLTIVNRGISTGEKLSTVLGSEFVPLSEIQSVECDILINTTPVGMYPNIEESPAPRSVFRPGMTVMDIIYTPRHTRFLQDARQAGCDTIDGLSMFVHQGVFQFEIWTGMEAPVDEMKRAVTQALDKEARS